MIPSVLSQRLVLLVIGLAAGSGILIPASYGSFHPVTSSEIQDGTIQTVDLANSAVTGAKIRDATITDHDLGADSVGANELKGVTKLIFAQCVGKTLFAVGPTALGIVHCNISGVDSDDSAIASINVGNTCFDEREATPVANAVQVLVRNECSSAQSFDPANISIIVFDK